MYYISRKKSIILFEVKLISPPEKVPPTVKSCLVCVIILHLPLPFWRFLTFHVLLLPASQGRRGQSSCKKHFLQEVTVLSEFLYMPPGLWHSEVGGILKLGPHFRKSLLTLSPASDVKVQDREKPWVNQLSVYSIPTLFIGCSQKQSNPRLTQTLWSGQPPAPL